MGGALPWAPHALSAATARMELAGVRRLLVLSGEPAWCRGLADEMRAALSGDWLWVGEGATDRRAGCLPAAIGTLLGREFKHAVFDAASGLAVDALAALAGTLTAGSWLVLLVPEWTSWPTRADADSLRWSEQPAAAPAPVFIDYFRQRLLADPEVVLWRQYQDAALAPLAPRPRWRPPLPGPTAEQRALLAELLGGGPDVFVLTAPRGRGKSALAGMLAARFNGECWVTAPGKAAAAVLESHAGSRARFLAPDALLERCLRHSQDHPPADWLLVDEAAAIPQPLLRRLIGYFPRVLLTTTVQGYEGSGRGFLLKFCASLDHWRHLTLRQPLRWAPNDPLERWLGATLLLDDPPPSDGAGIPASPPVFTRFCQERWRTHPLELLEFYQLLTSAHYRTTPLDLRRLMDAPGQHFIAARTAGVLTGALWSVAEGGLPPGLAHDVWAGRRRPPGNLAAQSLAAHGGLWTAPLLRSRRISRIAVTAAARRRGIGLALIAQALAGARGLDFISVSFGFTEELWQFWRAAGFALVHMGTRLEAGSGCYSAMALFPLSDAGHRLARRGSEQFNRDRAVLSLPPPAGEAHYAATAWRLNEDDWRTLAGFAFALRPPESCRPALLRLLRHSALPLPALRLWLEQKEDAARVAAQEGLSGKKAVTARWRSETAAALRALSPEDGQRWQDWSVNGGPEPATAG
ncbi:tRNA(Met) cytidine acetyltransferase TmcA [Sodalis sp. RH21]|uniref:tRNA(Met) cytidine acetyltransferase TmcA n=1 Tax=unclassified Sodalis (in: enterobacteria) TaxID=2636512 RepID=UPI0039B427BC